MNGLARIIGAAALGGVIVGGLIGFTTASDPAGATLSLDAVSVSACPGSDPTGTLHRGDRVLILGRSGDYLAVRNVRGSGERVFVEAALVVPDADLSNLPEVDCDVVGTLTVATTETTVPEETTTTTAAPEDSTTTTAAPEDSTTTSSSTTATTTPPTTVPPTTSPTTTIALPSVSNVSRSNATIREIYFVNFDPDVSCDAFATPSTSTISAAVSAPAGIQTVTMSWTSSIGNGSKPMSGSGTYSATLGPFDSQASPNVPNDGSVVLSVTVEVTDSLGRQATGQTTVTLNDCHIG